MSNIQSNGWAVQGPFLTLPICPERSVLLKRSFASCCPQKRQSHLNDSYSLNKTGRWCSHQQCKPLPKLPKVEASKPKHLTVHLLQPDTPQKEPPLLLGTWMMRRKKLSSVDSLPWDISGRRTVNINTDFFFLINQFLLMPVSLKRSQYSRKRTENKNWVLCLKKFSAINIFSSLCCWTVNYF